MQPKKPHLKLDPVLGDGSSFNVLPADTSAQVVGELILDWMKADAEGGDDPVVAISYVMLTGAEFNALRES